MNIDLTGKSAIVTGSTAGIGFAIARGLAAAGAAVVINGRSEARVASAVAQLIAQLPNAQVRGCSADVSHANGCAALHLAEPNADILVNNAGVYQHQDFFEIPDAEWERYFAVNVMSGIRMARACAQHMVAQGWGRIVFISSEAGLKIPAEMIHYGFTKSANLSVSRGLAKRLAGTGVTVNAVLPGPTLSDGVAASFRQAAADTGESVEVLTSRHMVQHRPGSLIRRLATVEEVANLVVYVCSLQASATTGAALRVDGGEVDTIA